MHSESGDLSGLTSAIVSRTDYDVAKKRSSHSVLVCDGEGQMMTSLIVAARKGHKDVVKYLVEVVGVDVEQAGSVRKGNHLIQGATALWCSAGAGHLEVVKILVEAGANVNSL